MSLDDLVRRRLLRTHTADRAEIRSLLLSALRRSEDASNLSVHEETRIEQAYHAVLSCALVALRATGYRPGRGAGAHELTLQTLVETLRLEPERVDYYQALRRQRHQCLYEGYRALSDTDVSEATAEARQLVRQTISWLREHHPLLAPDDLSDIEF